MSNPLDVAAKTLKEIVRQPRNLALTLGFPIAFMLIFGLAFGGSTQKTYDITVQNDDTGALGAQYVAGLSSMKYPDQTSLLHVQNDSIAHGSDLLKSRKVALVVHLPSNFTAGLTPPTTAPNNPGPSVPPPVGGGQGSSGAPPPGTLVETKADPAFGDSQAAMQIVAAYTQEFNNKVTGQKPAVRTDATFITATELNAFDFIVPGLMVYAVLATAPQAAAVLGRETELKTLDRIRLSPMRTSSLLAGVALAELAVSCVSVLLMFITARLMGFHNQGSYLVALGIAVSAAISVVGIGMVIASFARTQQEAANMGVLVSVPMSFLSGAFFVIPGVKLFSVAGHEIGLYDILPSKHAVDAMRQVMTFGQDAGAVMGSIGAMLALALLYFAAGVLLFQRARLTPD